MLYKTCGRMLNKRMPMARDCVKFCKHIAWQSFLVNNFADFLDVVRVKESRYGSVIGGVSYYLAIE